MHRAVQAIADQDPGGLLAAGVADATAAASAAYGLPDGVLTEQHVAERL